MLNLSWNDIHGDCDLLAQEIQNKFQESKFDLIIGVSRGGLIPACILSHILDIPKVLSIGLSSYNKSKEQKSISCYQHIQPHDLFGKKILFVDELCDSSSTLKYLKDQYGCFEDIDMHTAVLYVKEKAWFVPDYFVKKVPQEEWIKFPYETE
jgi:hypoxanthine phosphoribosyltransferase